MDLCEDHYCHAIVGKKDNCISLFPYNCYTDGINHFHTLERQGTSAQYLPLFLIIIIFTLLIFIALCGHDTKNNPYEIMLQALTLCFSVLLTLTLLFVILQNVNRTSK